MKAMIKVLTTAAVLSVAAVSAHAAGDEYAMVTDTVERLLIELGLPTDNVGDLTMSQVGEIIAIADSHEMGDAARSRVQKILGEN